MSDIKQGNITVNGDYVYRIFGGTGGHKLTETIYAAYREASGTTCARAIIAYGVWVGLNIIRDHSMPKFGLLGRGIAARDLSTAITTKLAKKFPGHPTDVINEVMTIIASKVKCLSDAQNTEGYLLKRAGVPA